MTVKKLFKYVVIFVGICLSKTSYLGNDLCTGTDIVTNQKNLCQESLLEYYIVSLREVNDNDRHICSGVILNSWFVFTTARCVQPYEPDQIDILTTVPELGHKVGRRRRVDHIDIHSLYNHLTLEHNVALIEVYSSFEFVNDGNNFFEFLNSPIPPNSVCKEYGWNTKLATDEQEKKLVETKVLLLRDEECKKHYNSINFFYKDMICGTVTQDEQALCKDDYGMVLFCDGKIAAVASWGCRFPVDSNPKLYASILNDFLWINALTGKPDNSLVHRITAGEPVTGSEILYQILITDITTGKICGGSIIDISHVLTAAHCVIGSEKRNLKITSNKRDLMQGYKHNVENITIHKNYSKRINACEEKICAPADDIAIIKISGKFPDKLKPVQLSTGNVATGTNCHVSGYGKTNYKEMTLSPTKAHLSIVDIKKCRQIWNDPTMPDSVICATDAEMKQDSCKGDSGGPLVCNEKLTGIVSFGEESCKSKRPSVHTAVHFYVDWIKEIIPTLETPDERKTKSINHHNESTTLYINILLLYIAQLINICS